MGKVRKVKKSYNYDKNRRRENKKRNKNPVSQCKQIKEAWDESRTLEQNMTDMGLVSNPNKTLGIPKAKDNLGPKVQRNMKLAQKAQTAQKAQKHQVVESMEEEANTPQISQFRLSDPDVKFCIHMMEKYGDAYKTMAKDHKNYYQMTPKQIKHKINQFKSIPEQYNEYLKSKPSQLGEEPTQGSKYFFRVACPMDK